MTVCPICTSQADSQVCRVTLGPGTEYALVRCGECGVMYTDPMPSDAELAAFYGAEYFDFQRHKFEGRGRAFARRYLHGRPRGRFLDVGCATGFFLNGVRHTSGWDVAGVDIGAAAARFARDQLGLDVREGELAAAGFPAGSFSFIHVSNVLEHAREPVAVLRECRRLLAPDGVLYLSIPNGDVDCRDLIALFGAEGRPARSKSGHIFFFPRATLLRMTADSGFTIAESHTYGIRRGLKILGWYPRPARWKDPYRPVSARPTAPSNEIRVPTERRMGDWYYRYRFAQAELKRLPGLLPVGLDFQLLLRPHP